nr:MAG TPA: hypothetical protein [Caudoviricetes sp.]
MVLSITINSLKSLYHKIGVTVDELISDKVS